MFLADRHFDRFHGYTWVVLCLALAFAVSVGRYAMTLPSASGKDKVHYSPLDWPTAPAAQDIDWTALRSGDGLPAAGAGSLATRFRLAGTFFSYADGAGVQRKAVIDTIGTGKQAIVQENEAIDGVTVLKIYHDRVALLDESGKEEELWLGFSTRTAVSDGAADTDGPRSSSEDADAAGIATHFGGRQVGQNSWIFQRQPLLDYYNELRAEPSRLYAVFESMKPIYGDGRQIFGYQLQIEGEKEFFDAAGLQEGDIVRKVNSVMMNNRRSAEHFISQFIRDEANIFLLDVEREGKPTRLSYRMR